MVGHLPALEHPDHTGAHWRGNPDSPLGIEADPVRSGSCQFRPDPPAGKRAVRRNIKGSEARPKGFAHNEGLIVRGNDRAIGKGQAVCHDARLPIRHHQDDFSRL